jgi:hypothetical protein
LAAVKIHFVIFWVMTNAVVRLIGTSVSEEHAVIVFRVDVNFNLCF